MRDVVTVPPSRLISLVGQALKWQKRKGVLPAGAKLDVFRGKAPKQRDEEEEPPSKQVGQIKFGKKSYPECALFSPDGTKVVIGYDSRHNSAVFAIRKSPALTVRGVGLNDVSLFIYFKRDSLKCSIIKSESSVHFKGQGVCMPVVHLYLPCGV